MADITETPQFQQRLIKCVRDNIKPTLSTIRILLIIMLPVSFAILVLKSTGILHYVSVFMNPLMHYLGLPGEAALAFVTSIFINIYPAIAVIKTMTLTGKQLIILATMCLIAHNFFVECFVMKKTGSSLRKMVFLRLFIALFAGWALHFIVPEGTGSDIEPAIPLIDEPVVIGFNVMKFVKGLLPWFIDSLLLVLKVCFVVFMVMLLQRVLEEFGLMKKLGKIAGAIVKVLGLSPNTAYVWIIGTLVGVAYGAGILIEEANEGKLSRIDADLFNHHAAISHSQIEDTFLFVFFLGAPYVWVALPRLFAAIVVVWVERARRALFRSSFKVRVV
jgi:hypothetical protein